MFSYFHYADHDPAHLFSDDDLAALSIVQKGKIHDLEQLIKQGYKIKALEFKLVNEAVIYDKLEILKKLISYGLNPLVDYDKHMAAALVGNKTEISQFFFELDEEKALEAISHYLSKHWNRPAEANLWCMEKITIRAIERDRQELEMFVPYSTGTTLEDNHSCHNGNSGTKFNCMNATGEQGAPSFEQKI